MADLEPLLPKNRDSSLWGDRNPNYPSVVLTAGEIAFMGARVGFKGEALEAIVAIALRESGGVSNAYRDASKNPNGGNDRGLLQWNDKWNPDVSDADAYDPYKAMLIAYGKVERAGGQAGLAGFGYWGVGPKPLGRPAPLTEVELSKARNGIAHPVDPQKRLDAAGLVGKALGPDFTDVSSPAQQAADAIADPLASLSEIVGRIGGNLLSGTWWKRIGVGALGLLLLVLAVSVAARSAALDTVTGGVAGKLTGGK